MDTHTAATAAASAPSPAVLALLDRLRERVDDIARRLVESYRVEMVDYRGLPEVVIVDDVVPTTRQNVEELLAGLRDGRAVEGPQLDQFRAAAVRRLHQNMSIQSLLRAYRLWGQTVWSEILAGAQDAAQREAVLPIAGRVMEYVDMVSGAAAEAYLEEAAGVWRDREVVRRDLLETLITGRPTTERARRQAASLRLDLDGDHVVVLVRRGNIGGAAEAGRGAGAVLRQALGVARLRLRPPTGALLVGIREEEVVAIRPAASTESFETVKAQARAAAAELPDFVLGAGRRHAGVDGVRRSYAEAQEAVSIGVASGLHGQFLAFSDVLLDRIVRSTRYADDLLDETVRPLHAYDAERRSELVRTLQAYFATRFSLTRSAAQLNVQPNTVTHRLRRIHTLTGHDPGDPDGLLLLSLGLKLHRLEPDRD
jgi:sugar diacid utilization regulator